MKKLFLILLTITLLSSGSLLQSRGFVGGGYGHGGGYYRGGRGLGAAVVAPLAVTGGILAGEALSNDGDYYDDGYSYDY